MNHFRCDFFPPLASGRVGKSVCLCVRACACAYKVDLCEFVWMWVWSVGPDHRPISIGTAYICSQLFFSLFRMISSQRKIIVIGERNKFYLNSYFVVRCSSYDIRKSHFYECSFTHFLLLCCFILIQSHIFLFKARIILSPVFGTYFIAVCFQCIYYSLSHISYTPFHISPFSRFCLCMPWWYPFWQLTITPNGMIIISSHNLIVDKYALSDTHRCLLFRVI